MARTIKSLCIAIIVTFLIVNLTDASLGSGGIARKSKTKSPTPPDLRDNDVEDIKRDSIHRHLMFTVDRISTMYIIPVFETALDMMWNIYDVAYWSYVDYLYPNLLTIWETIEDVTVCISSAITRCYTEYLVSLLSRCCDVVTDYAYSPIVSLLQMIWQNVVMRTRECLLELCSVINAVVNWIRNIYDNLYWIYVDYGYPILLTLWEMISDLTVSISNAIIRFYTECIVPFMSSCFDVVSDYAYSPMVSLLQMIWQNVVMRTWEGLLELSLSGFAVLWDCCASTWQLITSLWNEYLYPVLHKVLLQVYHRLDSVISVIFDWLSSIKDLMAWLWTICSEYVQPTLHAIFDWLTWIIVQCVSFIGDLLYGFVSLLFFIWDSVHRYLLEMNITKLTLPKQAENLQYFEIGIYAATLLEDNNSFGIVLSGFGESDYMESVDLWLRNDHSLKRSNAKIVVFDENEMEIYQRTIRLNTKQSYIVPLEQQLFGNEIEKCNVVEVEFMMEDMDKTKALRQLNHQFGQHQHINLGNDEVNGLGNVGFDGDGAQYIVTEIDTNCSHQFRVCVSE